jgi:pimeloyl-ACP methyl ester carboxylesterase
MAYAEEHGHLPIHLLGRSLGGAVAVNLATQELYSSRIQGVVLENTFTSIGDMIDAVLPFLRYFKFLQRNFWPSIDRVGRLKCPTLFVKSMRDELVPPAQMHRLMDAAKCYKEEYQIKAGTHNSSWDVEPKVYFARLL